MKIKAIVLAAGQGTRMNSPLPKVMHPICGQPMVCILLKSIENCAISDITVVVGPDMDMVSKAVHPYPTVIQHDRLGTAHAVLAARSAIQPFDGCALILFGDSPLIQPKTLLRMIGKYQSGVDVCVLGFIPEDPRRYGRLIMGPDGLEGIVEYKDATDEQRAIKLCNSGFMCVNGRHLLPLLEQVQNQNAVGEYYLTDIVTLARKAGLKCDVAIGDVDELHGVNTPQELETAQEIYLAHMGRTACPPMSEGA